MKRKEERKQSEGLVRLRTAENQNLGLPKPNRRSNFLYFSTYSNIFIDAHVEHMCYVKI